MSRENVEIVRRAYEEFNRTGEFDLEFLDPDCEFDPSGVLPDVGVFKGMEAVRDLLRQWSEAYDDFRIEAERVIDAGNNRVVAFVRDGGRLKGGEEIFNQFTHVWNLRNGKAVRWRTYTDRAAGPRSRRPVGRRRSLAKSASALRDKRQRQVSRDRGAPRQPGRGS